MPFLTPGGVAETVVNVRTEEVGLMNSIAGDWFWVMGVLATQKKYQK